MVPAKREDIDVIAANARQSDIDELYATGRVTPREAMEWGFDHSVRCWTGYLGEEPVCMFGVAPTYWSHVTGAAWMVGTTRIDRHPKAFLKGSRAAMVEMLSLYPLLVNFVDCRHTKAIKWLEKLGATFQDPQPYGVLGLPFLFFEIRR